MLLGVSLLLLAFTVSALIVVTPLFATTRYLRFPRSSFSRCLAVSIVTVTSFMLTNGAIWWLVGRTDAISLHGRMGAVVSVVVYFFAIRLGFREPVSRTATAVALSGLLWVMIVIGLRLAMPHHRPL